jgi:MFS family permease
LTFPLPPFGRLALVQSLSSAGDAMVAVALANSVFFNVSEKAAQSDVALSLALTVAPFAVVGPLLGPMVERVRGGRRAIALAAALGRAGCCFFMAFWVHSLVLFPIAFFSLVFSKLWLVTKAALVPGTVDGQEQLVQANSKLSVGGSMAGMLAGSAGVGLLNLVGGAGLLRFDILVYLGCAIAAARLTSARRPGPVLAPRAGSPPVDQTSGPLTAPPPPAEPPPTAALFTPPGLAPVAPVPPSSLPPAAVGSPPYGGAQPALWPATPRVPPEPRRGGLPPGGLQLAAVATAALRGSVGFVTFLLVFTFRHHGAALIWYGLALGASQVGNVTGALVAPRLRQRAPEEWMLTGSSVVVGGASLVAGIVHWGTHWPVAVLLAGGIGLAAGSGKVAFDSMVQRDVPSRIRARSFARFESGFQLAWALGSLLAVLIPMTLAAGFIAIGAVGLVGALAFAGGSIKARRGTLPAWFPGSAPRPTQPRLGGGPPPAPPP